MPPPDAFDDLSKLTLPPEAVAMAQAAKPITRRRRRRVAGEFYLCPVGWADRAAAAVRSSNRLILALRIYRRWRTRQPDEDTITVSQTAVAGPGFAPKAKRRVLRRLAAVGLIQVVSRDAGKAPRVRVVE